MKKNSYFLILLLVVVSGFVFANREIKKETKPTSKSVSVANKKNPLDEKKKWEASPDGIQYAKWEASPEGQKVQASYDKIKTSLDEFSEMEAVVTSVTFKRVYTNSSGPKWLIVEINGDTYMMQFVPEEFKQLKSLKVNDQIIVKSRSAGSSPNHPYLIISSDYIAKNNQVLFQRDLSKNNGC